ncbi:MAG: helix-turn-helix domain-containing protein [Clostridia bacterium]|nr:helix-turn-helix domain-containing protein [Clostridia bacterium]
MNPIRECRIERGLSQQKLADMIGVHQTAVSQWEKGRTDPDKQSLLRLSEALGVSADRLLGSDSAENSIPVLGYVRAGRPNEAAQQVLGYESRGGLRFPSGELFALKIRGDSMEPRFAEGDTVIVRREDMAPDGSVCVALIGDEATVKKAEMKNGNIILTALNPAYEPLVFTPEQAESLPVKIIGRVIELRARF